MMNVRHSEFPVLETRKVLMKHLHAKVLPLCHSCIFANSITSKIAEKLSDKEIISLLENDSALAEVVNSLTSNTSVIKQALGERLFVAVAELNSELCAQITGMLLELDEETLESLLTSSAKLQTAVQRAKDEYLKYTQSVSVDDSTIAEKQDDMGEAVYKLVLEHHPDPELAARLTGMLLELDSCQLQSLIDNSEELKAKLDIACRALYKS